MPSFIEREYLDKENRTLNPDSLGIYPDKSLVISKKPKNIVHCHDGYLEEYSTDDEQLEERKKEEQIEKDWNALPYDSMPVSEYNQLDWWNYASYHLFRNSKRAQWVGYGVGNFFAELFGITAPRFSYEMREAERIRNEKLREKEITKQCYVGPQGQLVEGGPGNNVVQPEIRLDNVTKQGDFVGESAPKFDRTELRTEYQEAQM